MNGWGEIAALAPCILGSDQEEGWRGGFCFVVFKASGSEFSWLRGSRHSRYKFVSFLFFCLVVEIGILGN